MKQLDIVIVQIWSQNFNYKYMRDIDDESPFKPGAVTTWLRGFIYGVGGGGGKPWKTSQLTKS